MKKGKPALERIYDYNVKKLYRFFYYKVLDHQIAEDLTSDTFIRLAEKPNIVGQDLETVNKYLFGIAKNVWNGHLRQLYRDGQFSVSEIDDFSVYVNDSLRELDRLNLQERAMLYIEQLPKKQREVAFKRLILGQTPTEIANNSRIKINTVKTTLRRSLRRLEKLVQSDNNPVTETKDA